MYQVLTHTFCDGWVNTWTDASDEVTTPSRFVSIEEAESEIASHIEDYNEDIAHGPADHLTREDFMIVPAGIDCFVDHDADRVLGVGDQFLDDWAEDAVQNGERDADYEERRAEWDVLRPYMAAAPSLLSCLKGVLKYSTEKGFQENAAVVKARALIEKLEAKNADEQ